MQKQHVTANGLRANFYQVDGQQSRAIIVLGGSEGGLPFADHEEQLQPLLDLGHPVLCLAYFKTEGLPQSLEQIPLEYFEQAFDWLSRQTDIPHQYNILGGSKGAELALLLASRYRQVRTVIASVPSHVTWQGIPNGAPKGPLGSSWSYAGKDIPFVSLPFSPALILALFTSRYRKVYEQALLNKKQVATATIPVEQMRGPLLLISARADTIWPSTPMSKQILQRLADHHHPFSYQHNILESGHAVQKEAAFWPLVTAFLQNNTP